MTRQGKTVNQPNPTRTTPPPGPTSTSKPANTMTAAKNPSMVSEDEIRMRAYQKWEAAGKPAGDGQKFWYEAERELRKAR